MASLNKIEISIRFFVIKAILFYPLQNDILFAQIKEINESYCFNKEKKELYESENEIDTVYFVANNEFFYKKFVKDSVMVILHYHKGIKIKAEGYYMENKARYRIAHFNEQGTNGFDTKYYKNGNKFFELYFKNDINLLPRFNWGPNGNLKEYNSLEDRQGLRTKISWHDNGIISYIEEPIKNKCLSVRSYYKNGKIGLQTNCLCGIEDYLVYDSLGNIIVKGKIKNYLFGEIGKWNVYYSNGKIKTQMEFSKREPGQRIGKWIYYKETGEIDKIEDYDKLRKVKTVIKEEDIIRTKEDFEKFLKKEE